MGKKALPNIPSRAFLSFEKINGFFSGNPKS